MGSLETLPITIYLCGCVIIGVIGNFTMVIATIRSKKLRSSCNIIVAIACFWDAIHLTAHIPLVIGYFIEIVIPQTTCLYWLILPVIGVFSCAPLLLSLAIDRLIAVRFPTWYNRYQKNYRFVLILLVIPFLLIVLQMTATIRSRTDMLLPCYIVNAFKEKHEIYAKTSMVVYTLIVIIYGFITYTIYSKGANSHFKRFFKSVTIQIFFLFFCWLIIVAIAIFSPLLQCSPHSLGLLYLYGGIPINTAIASNFFVFYKFSGLYRDEIRALFGKGGKKVTVLSTTLHV